MANSPDEEIRRMEAAHEERSTQLYGPKELRQRKNQRYTQRLVRRYSEPVIRGLLVALSRRREPMCARWLSEYDLANAPLTEMIDPFEWGGRHFYIRAVDGNKYTVEISMSFGRCGDGGTLTFRRRKDGKFIFFDEGARVLY